MFRSCTDKYKYSLRVKHDINEVIDVFTKEDKEKSRMWFRMNITCAEFCSKTAVPM